jgi:lantibiotic modifying enzyme
MKIGEASSKPTPDIDAIQAGLFGCEARRRRHRLRQRDDCVWSNEEADNFARQKINAQQITYAEEISRSLPALWSSEFAPVAAITGLDDLGGDAHQGRYPVRLWFENDCSAIYKPRSARFENLVATLRNGLIVGDNLACPPPFAFDAAHGSWWRPLPRKAVLTPSQATKYFIAAGMLLALAQAVGLSDLNHENLLIVHGLPFIIDAEFLCQPSMVNFQPRELLNEWQMFEQSVLSTLMLPLPGLDPDPSGLGSARGSRSANGVWTETAHCPLLAMDGRKYDSADYAGELSAGFRAGYTAILARRDEALTLLETQLEFVRVAIRPTAFYAELEGELWSQTAQTMSLDERRRFLLSRLPTQGWNVGSEVAGSICAHEADSLLCGDIPIFFSHILGDSLFDGTLRDLGKAFPEPPLVRRRRLLRSFQIADADEHVGLIQYAMACKRSKSSRSTLLTGLPS